MSPIVPTVIIPNTIHHVLNDMTFVNLISPGFRPDLRRRFHSSKDDIHVFQTETQKRAQLYAEHAAEFLKRVPVHLNLIPDDRLEPEKIKEMTDEELAIKYRTIRLSVSSSITGTLINIVLIPFLPAHAVGAVLNGWQTTVTLINRHHAKAEIERRIKASETSAQIIAIRLDSHKGRAQDVVVGMFVKGLLVAATMGFTDICSIPANADSLAHHASGAGAITNMLHSHAQPGSLSMATTLHESGHQAAHEALKMKVEAIAQHHPHLSHLPLDAGGFASDGASHSLEASNFAHFGVAHAPHGSDSIADLIRLHQEGLPTGVVLAETALVGSVAEGANLPAVVGDVVLEEKYEHYLTKKAAIKDDKATIAFEYEALEPKDEVCRTPSLTPDSSRSASRSPSPSPGPSPSTSPIKRKPVPVHLPTLAEYKRRRGQDNVFLFKG